MKSEQASLYNENTGLSAASAKSSLIIQPKLTVGAVDDPLEHEADAMADQVMRMPEPNFIQRKCSHCEDEEAQRKPMASFIQKKENNNNNTVSNTVHSQIQSTRGGGSAMPANTKTFMQSRFGTDFSNVRIHSGGYASQLSKELNAQAFTVGSDIYFNNGKFSPDSSEGKHLLAHELTHTLQQGDQLHTIRRQAVPAAEPVVEPSPVPIDWTREPANDNVRDPLNTGQPVYMPNPHDYSDDAVFRRGTMIINAERNQAYWQDKVQISVLEEGPQGNSPDFITTESVNVASYGGSGFQPGKVIHYLSKIKYDFEQANDMDALIKVSNKYAVWFKGEEAEKEACKKEPDFDLVIDTNFYEMVPFNYVIPETGRDLYKIRYAITDQMANRYRVLKKRERERQIAAELATAEATTLKGRKKTEGACSSKIVSHKGGNKKHNTFADHVASVKGYGKVNNEIAYTTPEGIEYSFDTYNPSTKKDVWEVKTYHEWLSDEQIGKAEHMKGGFEPRFLGLEEQRLRGLYVATRCGLNFRYAFDKCETVLGMRKHWLIPPVEYIPYPGEPKESCAE